MTLRKKLIRLAHENPELRADLLPLLKTAHGAVALKNPDVMLYWIDKATNKSKFYEMKVTRTASGFMLEKRWGRLTDSGASGRIDRKDEMFPDQRMAEQAMAKHEMAKKRKGYQAAPRGEYPIGLGAAGFGWGGQAACEYTPELNQLRMKLVTVNGALKSFGEIVSDLKRQKSGMVPALTGYMRKVKIPLQDMHDYLDSQLKECR